MLARMSLQMHVFVGLINFGPNFVQHLAGDTEAAGLCFCQRNPQYASKAASIGHCCGP